MRRLQILLAVTGVAAALTGAVLAQEHDDRGHPPPTMSRGMGRGEFPAGGRGAYEPPRSGAYWAKAMAGQDFSSEDRLDTPRYNRALWRGLKGDGPYPARRDGTNLRKDRPALLAAAGVAGCG